MAYTTVNKSTDYFNTKLYTGNGGTQSITGVGFQPDFTWLKGRSFADYHVVNDAVRGATKSIYPNDTASEGTQTNGLTSFDSDGFSIGNWSNINPNGETLVSWNWKAGTSVSGNTGGSGTAKSYSGSVNTTSGFSIIKYVGNGTAGHTIPHHLGTANIGSIFVKNLDSGSDYWYSYHKPLGATKTLILNETDAVDTNTMWNNTAPTSSVFTLGSSSGSNTNNQNYIAYIFSDIQGYCKTGSYTGNGSGDGTFVYTGFKPAFAILKCTNTARSWQIHNNKLNPFNSCTSRLFPNLSDAEATGTEQFVDFLSNGFKLKSNDANGNGTGNSYIYMAFAEAPLVGSNNVPCTAR